MDAEEQVNTNDGVAGVTEALELKELTLEERSRSLASKSESLQVRLDAALSEIESLTRANKALHADAEAARCSLEAARVREAGLLEAGRVAAAHANTLRASLAMASVDTEAAVTAAEAARDLEVRQLQETVTRLQRDALEKASEAERQLAMYTEQAAIAEQRYAWALRSTEREAETARLSGELEASLKKGAGLQKELDAAVAKARDFGAIRREVEQELRVELEAAQTAELNDLRASLAAAKAGLGEMKREKDAALQSLLEVAKMRTSPSCPSLLDAEGTEQDTEQQQGEEDESRDSVVGSRGKGAGVCERNGDMRWRLSPDFVAVHRNGEELRTGDLTHYPADEGSEDHMEEADFDDSSRSCVGSPGGTPHRSPGGAAVKHAAERRRTNDGGAWGGVGWHSSSETAGEHICRVCGAPAPSFRKLLDCRLSLGRARVEAAEARAQEELSKEAAASEVRKAQLAFAAIRERLEQRLAAEMASVSRLDETREAVARRVLREGEGEARGREAATRVGEIAALRMRLRLAEEEVGASRREVALEVQAASLAEVEAARKKAARAFAKAEALHDRCDQQEQTIASIAFARENEVSACLAAERVLAKERSALIESKERVQELELEVSSLTALLKAANKAEKQSTPLNKDTGGASSSNPSASRNHVDSSRFDDCSTPFEVRSGRDRMTDGRAQAQMSPEFACGSSTETNERERARLVFEESLHAAREEAKHLRRRVVGLRAALRKAQHRGDHMEAAAGSALAVADAKSAAVATAKADTAKAIKHEVEQNRIAAERRQSEVVEALQAELSRATAVGFEAREALAVAHGELARLRQAVGESDRRAAVLEENLALSSTSLHEADAGRVRALVDRVLGRGWEGAAGRKEDGVEVDEAKGRISGDTDTTTYMLPLGEGTRKEVGADGQQGFSLFDETATLRARLLASQAQHVELVRACEEAVACCSRRCEVRIRLIVAAGKLAVACSRKRGLVAGRESVVGAACRLAVLTRCFRALREEALSRSRDRAIRRRDRVHRWIREAFEQPGEAMATRNYSQHRHQHRRVGVPAEGGAGGGSLESFFAETTPARGCDPDRCH